MSSIRSNLLKWLILPLLTINLVGAGLTYWLAWAPAQIAFDQSLADAAWALIPRLKVVSDRVKIDLSNQAEQVLRVDHFDAIYFVVKGNGGNIIAGDKDFPPLFAPKKTNDPVAYDGVMRNEPIRVISLKTLVGSKPVLIGAAETLRKRNRIRSEIFLALIVLESVLLAVSISVVWFAVAKGMFPLKKMQTLLEARNRDDLSPMPDQGVPLELTPVVNALNGLLNRAETGARARQEFLTNIAHQLRTPLAGFKTQIEWLQQKYAGEADTAQSAALMMSAIERMIRQTNQLLALARAEPSQFEKKRLEVLRLDKLVEESIQDFVQQADKKGIDLGFDLHPTMILGDRFLLRDLIDNLVDNAIRYSPPNEAVTVRCHQVGPSGRIIVEDAGSGIPPAERERIFDRFYRIDSNVSGNGLGLAIVRDIANDHDAKILLTPGLKGKGTIFSVEFPLPFKSTAPSSICEST